MDAEIYLNDTVEGLMLAEVAALSLELARDLQRRALEAESNDEAARLAAGFQRCARSVRQTLAMKLKLIRELAADQREARRDAAGQAQAAEAARRLRCDVRARHLNAIVQPLIWTEREGVDCDEDFPDDPEGDALNDAFVAWVEAAQARPDFDTVPMDDLIAECLACLGLTRPGADGPAHAPAEAPPPPAAAADSS